uniref:PDR8/PEN3 (PLEIOTROPIC DRUG RESISTANCE8) n=1 Tax=Solanum tuberosum TaxID=4113 RepID=M1DH64_SOLTU
MDSSISPTPQIGVDGDSSGGGTKICVFEEDSELGILKRRVKQNLERRVGINLPTVEVRFEHLTIETDYYIGDRALPTLLNAAIVESALICLRIRLAEKTKLTILKDAYGIIKPSR